MAILLSKPPKSICILRLSAIGDISHTLPVVRTIQRAWPQTKITWIIGKTEYSLVHDIPDIEFIVFDKKQKLNSYITIYKQLKNRHFDILLHMQMSLRASLISILIKSAIKLGFDKTRAKDLQWLFTNSKIDYKPEQHVVDSFFCFTEALGINEPILQWDIPIPSSDIAYIKSLLPQNVPLMVISPCSSMAYRNWTAERYAELANYAYKTHGLTIVLSGGKTTIEQEYARKIQDYAQCPIIDLIGKTSLKQLLALLKLSRLVVSPDAGPAHLATAVDTPVIGLYASTNPDRARPYLSAEYVVNKYPEAVLNKFGKAVSEVPWGTRIRDAGTMELISVSDVCSMLDHLVTTFK